MRPSVDLVDATSITTGTDLTGLAVSGDSYVVKEHITLADIFGANNEAGLTAGSNFAALFAGHIPKNRPTNAENVIDPIIALIGI